MLSGFSGLCFIIIIIINIHGSIGLKEFRDGPHWRLQITDPALGQEQGSSGPCVQSPGALPPYMHVEHVCGRVLRTTQRCRGHLAFPGVHSESHGQPTPSVCDSLPSVRCRRCI